MPAKVTNAPDCLPEVGDEDERVGESEEGGKSSAMQNLQRWNIENLVEKKEIL